MKSIIYSGLFLSFFSSYTEFIGHECGFAFLHFKKPLTEIHKKYGTPNFGIHKMRLLMEKQRNRGQDGAGLGVVKYTTGEINRIRFAQKQSIDSIFLRCSQTLLHEYPTHMTEEQLEKNHDFLGRTYLGHLRYGTHSGDSTTLCQPLLRYSKQNNQRFLLAGNFNLTNTQELLEMLDGKGIQPKNTSDTQVVMEHLFYELKKHPKDFHHYLVDIIASCSEKWDGGYTFVGVLGTNEFFMVRDPYGIRPGFYYEHEDFIAAASERSALMNTFDVETEDIKEIKPGSVITWSNQTKEETIIQEEKRCECSFERIYFSRPEDPDIYQERKALGKELATRVLEAIDYDIKNAVFCFVPNTSQIAFEGLVQELEIKVKHNHLTKLCTKARKKPLNYHDLEELTYPRVRVEHILNKNQKLRTFIAQASGRSALIKHMYGVTRGIVKPTDTIVVLDDSIVRGATLQQSIIEQLISLHPKRIIIVSSAPPILFPDCYGIDMSQLELFVAFRAALQLIYEHDKEELLEDIYDACVDQMYLPPHKMKNHLKKLYDQFTHTELENKIAELITPKNTNWKGEIKVLYQTIEGLHKAIPNYSGDWYFSGNYPTPGGYKVVNTSYYNWWNGINKRAY